MTSNIQAAWVPLDGYKAHIAQANLDFSTDNNWRVSFSNALYDGSVIMKPRYVTIDNLGNPASVTLTMNGVDTVILPFERTEKVLTGNMGFLDFSAAFGSCVVLISEGPFTQKATSDNLYGTIFPSLKNSQQTIIAASVAGPNPSHTVTLKAGEIVVWVFDINSATLGPFRINGNWVGTNFPELETFDQIDPADYGIETNYTYCRWFGLPYERNSYGGSIALVMAEAENFRYRAASANRCFIMAMRAKANTTVNISVADGVGSVIKYTSFVIQNCKSGDMLDIISDTRSLSGGSNPTIASVAAATVYTLPSVNLSGLKRFALMCIGVTNATLASAEAIGSVALTERYDNNGQALATGWVEKAGTTDNPVFTHAAAAGQTLEYAMCYLKGG